MLMRSISMYAQIQRMFGGKATNFAAEGTNTYDLDCSTGTTLLNLNRCLPQAGKFIRVDYSEEMWEKCKEKLKNNGFRHD